MALVLAQECQVLQKLPYLVIWSTPYVGQSTMTCPNPTYIHYRPHGPGLGSRMPGFAKITIFGHMVDTLCRAVDHDMPKPNIHPLQATWPWSWLKNARFCKNYHIWSYGRHPM